MIVYVDIDGTICKPYKKDGHVDPDYRYAEPIPENIEKINKLFNEGNTIIYWTARGTITQIDWLSETREQLHHWGARYHDVRVGKPYYDLFIDDKAIKAEEYFKNDDA
jgi:hydroxymethylpyrimidine pyrophosphatase-like HAD family hydrolase|tara:strand:- start:3568 stop:3891 length:324 start_codon:yes stop_codon:yes gene_type:complete